MIIDRSPIRKAARPARPLCLDAGKRPGPPCLGGGGGCSPLPRPVFFPIPADVMVLPMMLADRRRAFRLGAWVRLLVGDGRHAGLCHRRAVLGNGGPVADPCPAYSAGEGGSITRSEYSQHAYLIMVQGATPIPYKLVTIASGLAGVQLPALHALFGHHPHHPLHRDRRRCWCISSANSAKALLEKYLEVALVAVSGRGRAGHSSACAILRLILLEFAATAS